MVVDVEGIKQIGCPINMSESEPEFAFKGGAIGEHNEILKTEFGYSDEQFAQLQAKGIFGSKIL
jgi:crotonobetainyl-CoA:carnitine CoA-transferase CaiB-like acyl-CoA transferase